MDIVDKAVECLSQKCIDDNMKRIFKELKSNIDDSLILKCPKCGHHFYQVTESGQYHGRRYKCGVALPLSKRDYADAPITQDQLDKVVLL